MAGCDVQTEGLDLEIVNAGNFGGFNGNTLRVSPFAALNGGNLLLLDRNFGGSVTGFEIREAQRVGDGFSVTLGFNANDGTSDGFAFVLRPDPVNSVASGGGSLLGFSEGSSTYVAIGIDFCDDRNARSCDDNAVRFETRINSNNPVVRQKFDNVFDLSGQKTIQIDYRGNGNPIWDITIGGVTRSFNFNIANFLDDSLFAFIAVTGSNTEVSGTALDALNLNFNQYDVALMNSGFRLSAASLIPVQTDAVEGASVVFTLEFVDTCNEKLAAIPGNINLEDIEAELIPNDPNNQVLLPLDDGGVQVAANDAGAVTIVFQTPPNLEETWTLDISINRVRAQRHPIAALVSSEVNEVQNGLGVVGVALIVSLLVVLVIVVFVIARLTKKYRDNLVEHDEDIQWGKAKEKTVEIEQDVVYEMSPLVAPLEEIKARLARNEELLASLRKKEGTGVDSNKKVADLQAKNEALRVQIAELKRKNEFAQAAGDGRAGSGRLLRNRSRNDKKALDVMEEI